jgi:hypothetical protein
MEKIEIDGMKIALRMVKAEGFIRDVLGRLHPVPLFSQSQQPDLSRRERRLQQALARAASRR